MRSVTVGSGFFADIAASWEDAGKGGQLAFQEIVEPLLEPITFNDQAMAFIWRPHPSVWINLAVQAGTPCVDGTRVPTSLLADLVDTGKSIVTHVIAQLCDTYRLTREHVREAIAYEVSLAA